MNTKLVERLGLSHLKQLARRRFKHTQHISIYTRIYTYNRFTFFISKHQWRMSTARTHTRSKITVNICLCICLLWPIYSCTRIYYAKEHSHNGLLIYYCKGSRLLALRRDKRTKNVRAKRVLCRVREYLTKSDEFAQTHLLDLRAQSRTEDYTRNGQELLKWNCRNMRAKEVHLPASAVVGYLRCVFWLAIPRD